MTDLDEWREMILRLDNIKPNRREVFWFHNQSNEDRFEIAHYMKDYLDGRWTLLTDIREDATKFIRRQLESGWKQHGVMINLNCKSDKLGKLYSSVENVKNGALTSIRGRGDYLLFNIPHVVVLSNDLPLVNQISHDRWRIFSVEEGKAIPMSVEEVLAQK